MSPQPVFWEKKEKYFKMLFAVNILPCMLSNMCCTDLSKVQVQINSSTFSSDMSSMFALNPYTISRENG